MAIISSHVLDSVIGDHAKQIRIQCFRIEGDMRILIFDVQGNEQGRIVEEIEANSASAEYELAFHTAAYFAGQPAMPQARQNISVVTIRFTIPESDGRVHIPMMLSPHAYSIWWSA